MKCIFCGSPDFAVPFLRAVCASDNHSVVGVITQPDRPARRGLSLSPPAVKIAAETLGLPILQPLKINDESTIEWIKKTGAEILVVVAYGEFLGKAVLNLFKTPPINVHPSMLPKLRGAAPIQWALVNGYHSTGVSIQFMAPKMDAGDIILQREISIGPNDTAEDLFHLATPIGITLLLEALDLIGGGGSETHATKSLRGHTRSALKKGFGPIAMGHVERRRMPQ